MNVLEFNKITFKFNLELNKYQQQTTLYSKLFEYILILLDKSNIILINY
jgi:hypothetical protein